MAWRNVRPNRLRNGSAKPYTWTMTTTKTRKPLTPGQPLPWTIPGTSAVIVVTLNTDHSCNVTIWQGAVRCDGWSHTFPTEAEARAEARRAVHLFHRHRTAEAVEARRDMLIQAREEQVRRQARGHNVRARLDSIDADLDALETFGDRVMLAQLRRDLDRHAA